MLATGPFSSRAVKGFNRVAALRALDRPARKRRTGWQEI
jgi:hypothetical protein